MKPPATAVRASPVTREPTHRLLRRRRTDDAVTAAQQRRAELRRLTASALRARNAPSLDDDEFDVALNMALWRYGQALQAGTVIDNESGWLTTVISREVLSARDRAHRRHDVALPDDTPLVSGDHELDNALYLDAASQQALRALTNLPQRSRRVVVLQRVVGLPRSEIAAQMGISEKAVKKALERAAPVLNHVAGLQASGDLCADVISDVRAYATRQLDRESQAYRTCSAHLRGCPQCRAIVREVRGIQAVLPPLLIPTTMGVGVIERLMQYADEALGQATLAGSGGAAAVAGSTAVGGSGLTLGTSMVSGLTAKIAAGCVAGAVCVGGAVGVRETAKPPESPKPVRATAAQAAASTASPATSFTPVTAPVSIAAVAAQARTKARRDIIAAEQQARADAARKRKRERAAARRAEIRTQQPAAREFGFENAPPASAPAATAPPTAVTAAAPTATRSTAPSGGTGGATSPATSEFGIENGD